MTRANSYTPEQIEWLREGYLRMKAEDLTEAFNARFGQHRTVPAIKTILNRHKIHCGRPAKDRLVNRQRMLTPEQVEYLRENYRDISLADMTDNFNRHFGTAYTQTQITTALKNRGINSGRTGHFRPGHQPWNAGTKGMTQANSGSFTDGHEPHNTKWEGYERVTKDGIVEVSVREPNPHTGYERRFRPKHVLLWEQHNGPVPDSHCVVFRDGDPSNIAIDNFELMHRLELLRLNKRQHRKAPDEIKPVLITLARLEAKAIFLKNKAADGGEGE